MTIKLRAVVAIGFLAVGACSGGQSAREDLAASAKRDAALNVGTFPATVVLVDKLPLPNATVIVVRRVTDKPTDLIAISAQHATPGALGAGIQALVRSRQIHGAFPPRDTSIVVLDETIPKSWSTSGLSAEAVKEIEDLKRAPIRDITGFGKVRAREIQLAPGKP